MWLVLHGFCFPSLGDLRALGKCKCFGVAREGLVLVTVVREVGRAPLWMAPNSVFQHVVPNVTTTGLRERRVRELAAFT
jgi:hypothetical protein